MNNEFDFELTAPEPRSEVQPQPSNKAAARKKKKNLTPQQRFFKESRDILVVVCLFMVVYMLFFRAVVVVGSSMYDTLVNGDRLLVVNNLLYRDIKQGDIIVISKDSFRNGECIIKRVIATEGQEVYIDFTTGIVKVDDQVLDESAYLYTETTRPEGMIFPLTVPEGCIFVMGDNRADSMDSRDPAIGLIDEREVLGKAVFLLWPGIDSETQSRDFDRIGVVD